MSDNDGKGSGIKVGPDTVDLRVSDEATRQVGGGLRALFSARMAKADIDRAAGRRIAEKIEQGDFVFEPVERFFLSRIYRKELRKFENQRVILERATEVFRASVQVPGESSTPTTSKQLPAQTSEDWINRFLSYAEDVSDDTVRDLYARLGAGEAKQPGSFSLGTLSVLRNLDADTIKKFERLRSFVLNEAFVLPHESARKSYDDAGLDYATLLHLAAVGLLNLADTAWSPEPSQQTTDEVELTYGTRTLRLGAAAPGQMLVKVWLLTAAGQDLIQLVRFDHSEQFFSELASGAIHTTAQPIVSYTPTFSGMRWSDDGKRWTTVTAPPKGGGSG